MNSNAAPLLSLRGVSKAYGYQPVLREIDLDLAGGEIVCLLGPNGAGKSTLLSTLTSRNPPDQGEIVFRGQTLDRIEARRAYLAATSFLGHEPGLFLDFSARENLEFFWRMHRRAAPDQDRIHELLKRTGLDHRANDRARSFSRGMQQRLGLCRVFLSDPEVILLDEPLTGLDRAGAAAMRTLLEEFAQTGGTALITTHDEDFFRGLAGRYVFLKQGRLVADIADARYTENARSHVHALLYEN